MHAGLALLRLFSYCVVRRYVGLRRANNNRSILSRMTDTMLRSSGKGICLYSLSNKIRQFRQDRSRTLSSEGENLR